MNKFSGITTLFLLWIVLISSEINIIVFTLADGGQYIVEDEQNKLSASQILRDIHSRLTKSSKGSWDKLKILINQLQKQFFPPNLESRDGVISSGGNEGRGGRIKEAAQKSFGTSKVAVEESAKTAANAVGEAVHKTAQKVKKTISDKQQHYSDSEDDAEL